MSVKERKLSRIDRSILNLKRRETEAKTPFKKECLTAQRFGTQLYYEIVKNDVTIRAESLSYFTFFSIMPLMTGVFLLIGLFSQWAPVQKEFEGLLDQFLDAIPDEQRDTLLDFILQFKDAYLAKISQQSTVIGIFALGVLLWIAGKVFFNLEALMNRIWAVTYERPFMERIQNFILCIVILPLSYIAALSLPGIIEHFGQKEFGIFLHDGIPVLILFFSLSFIFKYFPNTKVKWRSAHLGALAGTVGFGVSHVFLRYYFRFGTSTGYGKAAILPIFAFFIYVSWLIFIVGVEVSLLAQSSAQFMVRRLPTTTLGQALLLEKTLKLLEKKFKAGTGPTETALIIQELEASFYDVVTVLSFLRKKEVVVRISHEREKETYSYVLARELSEDDLLELIKDYLDVKSLAQSFDVYSLITRLKRP